MEWTKHISRRYNREYWYNRRTHESVWVLPSDNEQKNEKENTIHCDKPLRQTLESKKNEKREETQNVSTKNTMEQKPEKQDANEEEKVAHESQKKPEEEVRNEVKDKPKPKPKTTYENNRYNRSAYYEEEPPKKYSMNVVNGNGMSWCIEGGEHWTKEDYREKLEDLNQSLRDF